MGNVVIHIGPPKTATTSLQYFLAQQQLPDFHFGGVFQPRNLENNLSTNIFKFTTNGEHSILEAIKKVIDIHLVQGKDVLISEEMLLLHSKSCHIERRIENLAKLINHINAEILLTIRNPKSALPSLYQEIYKRLPLNLQNDFYSFCYSDYAKAFDYDWLEKKFNILGVEKISYLNFYELTSGRVKLSDITKNINHEIPIILKTENVGSKNRENKRVLIRHSNFEKILIFIRDRVPIKTKRLGGGKLLMKFAKSFRLKRKTELIIPSNIEKDFMDFMSQIK